MNPSENDPRSGKPLATSDLAAAAAKPRRKPQLDDEGYEMQEPRRTSEGEAIPDASDERHREGAVAEAAPDTERLEPLFPGDLNARYRSRWASIQSSFVDDPKSAAKHGDELVAEMMQSLAKSFADERQALERQLGENGEASTESLRVALRRYRSFFDRLLSL
jgi:uncharacterized protein YukE